MKMLIRVDASAIIGTGHVIRCLTLANEAKLRGWSVCFVIRCKYKHIIRSIRNAGHEVRLLDTASTNITEKKNVSYSHWLGVSQETDASDTLEYVRACNPDWVVIDHYSLDVTWHRIIKSYCQNIMVIDDLANRILDCSIILDQNLNARAEDYRNKLNSKCMLLLGPSYALLRPEFRIWRQSSLDRRVKNKFKQILITMGGVDLENYTLSTLRQLEKSKFSKSCSFVVAVGSSYPNSTQLEKFVNSTALSIAVITNVNNMAEVMAKSDLCIGAAGSTSWERCCLGLPTIAMPIAENQEKIITELHKHGVAIKSNLTCLIKDFEKFFNKSDIGLANKLVLNSKNICDGLGASRVIAQLE